MSAPHRNRRQTRCRQLRLERCEDRALLSGDGILGAAFVPTDTLTLNNDSAYIAQDRDSILVGDMNFYDFNATVMSFSKAGSSLLWQAPSPISGIWPTDLRGVDGYNGSSRDFTNSYDLHGTSSGGVVLNGDYGRDLDFTAGATDDAGVLISPQIPIIPSVEETSSGSPSPAPLAEVTPTETISLASVLRNEPVTRRVDTTQVAQATPAWNAALEKPAFLNRERQATRAPEAIETLDRAFALEGLELEANRPAVNSNSDATDAAQTHQPQRGSVYRDGVRSLEARPAITQTSFTIPLLQSTADAQVSDELSSVHSAGNELVEVVPPTWPAYLMSKARQTGLALTLGTVAIAIRLRWQRAEEELPQRSSARKFPNA